MYNDGNTFNFLRGDNMAFDINNYKNSDLDYKTKIFFEDLERYLSKENDMTANLANTAAFI